MGGMRSFGLRSAMFLAMTAAPVLGATTPAPASSFTGNFANDADQKEFFFSLATAGPITVRTLSYAGGTNGAGNSVPPGGFDTTLSLYDSTGALIAVNQDGGCALVATDPVTGSCWDAYLSVSLPAGTYRVVLTQSLNMPAGTTLADSFLFNPNNLFNNSDTVNGTAVPPLGGQTGFTAPPGQSGSFWDFFPNQRTSFYAIDIAGATTAVAPAVSSSSTLQFGIVGTAYSLALGVQSGAGVTYTWTPPASGLPPGLAMDATGAISGMPTTAGTYTFTAIANDGVQAVQQTETIVVYNPLTITTSSLPAAVRGQIYGPVQLASAGGSGMETWSATGLTGLVLSPSGSLSGVAPASVPSFSVTATDTVTGQTASQTYSVTVNAPPLLVSGGGTLPEVAAGQSVSSAIGVSGGTPPYAFNASGLPAGLSLSSTGSIGGTPGPGSYSFSVTVTDSQGQTSVVSFSLSVLGFISTTLPQATYNMPYAANLSAAGGTGSDKFSGSGLPAGLSLSSGGAITGTPTVGGTFSFTVQVTDGVATATATASLTISGGPTSLTLPGGTLTKGQVGSSYTSSIAAAGGTGPYTYTLLGGILPTGLSLSSSGQIAGTPTLATSFSFTVQVKDSTGATVAASYTIVIAPAPLVQTSTVLPTGIVGVDYPVQILTPTGGVAPYTLTIASGSIPPGLTFSNGQIGGTPTGSGSFSFTVSAVDSSGLTSSASYSILINPAAADLILSDTLLSFSVMQGQTGLPTSDNVTVRSSVVAQQLNYSYALSPAVPWLSVSGGTTTPGSLLVSPTAAILSQAPSASPYTTSLQVSCMAPSPCAGHTQTVNISLSVTAPPAQLTLTNSLLSFSTTASNTATMSLPLGIENSGGGTLTGVSASTGNGWVTVSGVPATLAAGPAVSATVTVNPAGLPTGYNSSSVTVNSSAGSVTVPVSLNIAPNPTISLSPATQQFSVASGGSVFPNSGSFQVSTNTSQPVAWTASVQPGAPWLTAVTPSGSSTVSSAGGVSYAIDNSVVPQLPPGTYYGIIQVAAAGAANSPQNYEVQLIVGPPASLPIPNVTGGLLFITGSIATQQVGVGVANASSPTESVAYQASATTTDGANWLSVTPATGSTSPSNPAASTISVSSAGLAPGIYFGLVSYAFSAAAVRSVNVTYLVTGAGALLVTDSGHAATCSPTQLVATQTGLTDNFSQPATLPVALRILLTDNCGNPVSNAQVGVTFSNGDAPLTLAPVDNVSGIYTGTWVPLGVSPEVSVIATATAAGLSAGSSRVNGLVTLYAGPVLTQNAVLSVYNPLIGGAISPGAILQIYGSNLAAAPVTSSMLPLTTTLGNTSVTIGGTPVPLYYVSPTQINAQAPFELVPGNQYQVVVNVNGALTAPGTINVGPVEPGIAGFQNGYIVAQHLDGTLVTDASPAQPGTYVVFYLAGLGSTDTPVADGAASPVNPLSHPLVPPVLTLNGVVQPYQFVGLTPDIVALYQINFLVPQGTPNGDLLLTVSQSGVPSNSVILPVHQ